MTALTEIRPGHEFDQHALTVFMENNVEGFTGPLHIRQFDGGQSNPTFMLQSPTQSYVLRKQPPGELLPSAHQVDREYRVMKALYNTEVPVPKMYALCEDVGVIGTKFYIMEAVEGRIFEGSRLEEAPPTQRRELWRDFIRVLAAMHSVDYKGVGLESYGRPGNYFERQVNRWSKQYAASKTEHLVSMENLLKWVPEHIPDSDEVCIAHGDYRIQNVMFHPSEPRVVAVLDWELSTLGHPLADLGYATMEYNADFYDEATMRRDDLEQMSLPALDEVLIWYCDYCGRDKIEHWEFYVVYNLFRSAAIVQGVYKRGLDGNASSTNALEYKDECRSRVDRAWEIVQSSA